MADQKLTGLTEETTPANADLLYLVTDSTTSKKVTVANLLGQGNITILGTIATGIWNGTAVADGYIASAAAWNALVTNVSTNLSEGTSTETTVDVNSSDGTNATLVSASTSRAGLLTKAKWDEIVVNNGKITNQSHTGDVVGSTSLVIQPGAVDIAMLSATGTPSGSNFLRGDNTWATPAGSGNVSTSGTPVANDFARFVGSTDIEGRSYAETKSDLSLDNVTNVATDDTAYNETSWNANTDAATKNAIRDKIETMDTAIGLNTSKTGVTTQISNLSEDGTPQLGGELDCNNNDIVLGDDQKLYLNDAKTSYIVSNSSTGTVEIWVGGVLKVGWD